MMRAFFTAIVIAAAAYALGIAPDPAFAQNAQPVPNEALQGVGSAIEKAIGSGAQDTSAPLSFSLQLLLVMSLLTILPGLVLMMTSFTRILIVLAILRQAMGLQQSPPNQVLAGLALFLSLFVMGPTLSAVNELAIMPYSNGLMTADQAILAAGEPFHEFMVRQTREANLSMFADIAGVRGFASPDDVPFSILMPAFVTSELETAFQIGFMLFLPFLVIDLVTASVLMSLGMMMLSPTIVSLPFKLLLFVIVDGWALLMGSLAMSFT